MKLLPFFLFTFFSLISFSQGLRIDTNDLKEYEKFSIDEFGFSTEFPSNYSLDKFAPSVQLQKGNSCVGWATTYYAMSIMYNQKFNITDFSEKEANAFDPNSIFLWDSIEDYCDLGTNFNDALDVLKFKGAKKLNFFPKIVPCQNEFAFDNSMINSYVKPFAIGDIYPLSNIYSNERSFFDENGINGFKHVINKMNLPIMCAFNTPKSFDNISSNGLWSPLIGEKTGNMGHALTIVGYDDYKFGGSFKLINSYGDDWGDNGFLWIKYADIDKYLKYSYAMKFKNEFNVTSSIQIKTKNFIKLSNTDGSSYEGEFLNETFHGYGVFKSIDDFYYFGEYKYNTPVGNFLIYSNYGYDLIKFDQFGNVIEEEDYGFATEKSDEEIKLEAFFKYINPNIELKKSKASKIRATKLTSEINKSN